MLVSPAVGYWLDFSHESYGPLFVVAGITYLVTFLIIHLLLPKFEQVYPVPIAEDAQPIM